MGERPAPVHYLQLNDDTENINIFTNVFDVHVLGKEFTRHAQSSFS